jgi:simple sugar transport system substrate-binding protein
MKLKSSIRLVAVAVAAAIFASSAPAVAQEDGEQLQFNYIMHDKPEGVFWNIVYRGMLDACADLDVDCQMIGSRDPAAQLSSFQASVAAGVDGIVTTLPDDEILDKPIQDALDLGIPVIAANTDDSQGAAGNPRLSYTGSNIYKAAYDVAAAVTEMFPAEGDLHALVGNFDPTHNVGIARTEGMEQALADWSAANPDRNITWEQIEETLDPSIVRSRVGAYLQVRPDTNVYLTSGIWHPEIAKMLREEGRQKGEILIAGFGAFQWAIDEIKDGWIAITQDQGAYLQGYLPIVQLYLLSKGLPPFNVDTEGALKGVVDAEAAPTLSGLRIWTLQ